MKVTLADIEKLVASLAEKINAPQHLLPTYGHSTDGAHPHIEVDQYGQLYYVIAERGQELRRDLAADTNDLLYIIFSDISFSMAVKFELHNRIEKADGRRQMFSKQEALLATLNKDWTTRIGKEHLRILSNYPFDDAAITRADYCKQLTGKGTDSSTAWNEACKKYPLPTPA